MPPPPEDARPALDPAAVAAGLGAVAAAPAFVILLRLFPGISPPEHGAAWLLPLAGGAAALALAVGMLVSMERGLRRGSNSDLLRSVALGVVAVGLAVASLRSAAPEAAAAFPDGGLAVTALAGAVLLLVAQLAGESVPLPTRRSPVVWLMAFGVVEAGLAAAVLLPATGQSWPWFAALAAATVGAAAVGAGALPGPWVAAGLTAAGLVALGAARLGTLDVVPGLAALAAGGLAYGLRGTPAAVQEADQADADSAAEDRGSEDEWLAVTAENESMRLARELRGTIEELLHARRTIELQREEIAQAATVDALTGVATRRAILERLAIEAAGARRYQHPFALVLLDLDGFARLNHEHGTQSGDAVLREVALRLRLRVRAADALGRVGSDSFLAVLPHTNETGAATFADALRRLLTGRAIDTAAGELAIAVSIGVAFMRPGMSLTDEELLASADEALASARAAGGNRIAFDRAHGLIRLEERRADRDGA